MRGYRNGIIILATVGCQTFVAHAGILSGTELVGLATVLGAISATAIGGIFGRGYQRGKTNGNGG